MNGEKQIRSEIQPDLPADILWHSSFKKAVGWCEQFSFPRLWGKYGFVPAYDVKATALILPRRPGVPETPPSGKIAA
jgi:hypothetical protein